MTAVVGPETALGTLTLHDPPAEDLALAGAKGAALARAEHAGLPVIPGFVITIPGTTDPTIAPAVRRAWEWLSDGGRHALAVRSSSSLEDGSVSSMAGRFVSVLDVRGWEAFCDAVGEVLNSSDIVTLDGTPTLVRAPMAILVQRMLVPVSGGVMFGLDPVTGRLDRLAVAAVEGGPHHLVHGETDGTQYTLTRRGREVARTDGEGGAELTYRQRRALARLAAKVESLFGGPQDVEWAIDEDDHLWLLQSRPVTAVSATARGTVWGPGPVAETFPDPLAPLEDDLWIGPMAAAVREALALTGAAGRRRLDSSGVIRTVGGRAAADLQLLGAMPTPAPFIARFNPVPPARRLRASWRVGRLRAALPALAKDVVQRTDALLAEVPTLDGLADATLIGTLRRTPQALIALHGHEVLMGMLVTPDAPALTGAAVALQTVARARADGIPEHTLVARHPVSLALTPPAIGPVPRVPETDGLPPVTTDVPADEATVLREALRLRVRWMQELGARIAWELGTRLTRRGVIAAACDVRLLSIDELAAMVSGGARPADLDERHMRLPDAPLPSAFRLGPNHEVVPFAGRTGTGGVPAGGGRGVGTVHQGQGQPPQGSVLVVRSLEPSLATVLPRLAGLVSETGSPLSHLAILAREMALPVVVAVPDALERFPAGATVVVDGTTGEVSTEAEQ